MTHYVLQATGEKERKLEMNKLQTFLCVGVSERERSERERRWGGGGGGKRAVDGDLIANCVRASSTVARSFVGLGDGRDVVPNIVTRHGIKMASVF